jgi:hypothetical protein
VGNSWPCRDGSGGGGSHAEEAQGNSDAEARRQSKFSRAWRPAVGHTHTPLAVTWSSRGGIRPTERRNADAFFATDGFHQLVSLADRTATASPGLRRHDMVLRHMAVADCDY